MIFNTMTPIDKFSVWLSEASRSELNDPNAMTVASCVNDIPSVRVVLLKHHDDHGFVFYTNFNSRKGTELQANRNVALNFHWKSLQRQVRIVGTASRVSDEEADAYFKTRPYDSKVGAWASRQSEPLESYATLLGRAARFGCQFTTNVPRPPHWSGFRVQPLTIEFWSAHRFKLHERYLYTKVGDDWSEIMLNP